MAEQPIPDTFENDLVYRLSCDPATGRCFAARGSGLYRSDAGGSTWTFAYESLAIDEPLPTISVAMAPGSDTPEDLQVFAGVPGGVLRSSDGGATWIAEPLGSPPPAVSDLVISPDFEEDGVILAGTTEDGVYRSANRGSHWTRWNFGLLDLNVMCLAISPAFAEDETLFAGVESGIFRSTNGARAWREVDLPVGFEPVLSLALSPDYADDGTIFAGTESQGLLRSEDGGKHWTRVETGDLAGPVNQLMLSRTDAGSFTLLALLEDAVQVSRDGGATWQALEADVGRITAVAAPEGLGKGAPLLVGCLGGEIERLELTV
jgi:photosystem II stability/assembly factor-like uncharacterized protein